MAGQRRNFLNRLKPWLRRLLKFSAGLFVGIHIYALSLSVLPIPGTLNIALNRLSGEQIDRRWVAMEQISPHLIQAVIGAEDSGFCFHKGVSLSDIRSAYADYQSTGRLRGASTLTQQTAKNVFFWNGGGLFRKAGEAWMAVFIDQFWGKRRVLEVYLNVAEFGDGLYGVEAAAQRRFGRSAQDLTPYQAALLAAVLPSPNRYRLDPPTPFIRRQAATYRARMRTVASENLDQCVQKPEPS